MTFDHLVLAGPDLDELRAWLHGATGVGAVGGGRHLGHGTHNALSGLGPSAYLELVAPDPSQAGGPFAERIAQRRAPAVHTWCVRAGDAAQVAALARAAGLSPQRFQMERRRDDDTLLRWEVVFLDGHDYGTLLPFCIDWGATPHPATTLPAALQLDELELTHPDAEGLQALLERLGGAPSVVRCVAGAQPALRATLRHASGRWRPSGLG